jgi:hypothetical protein
VSGTSGGAGTIRAALRHQTDTTFYATIAQFVPVLLLAVGFQIGLRGVRFFRGGRERWVLPVLVILPLMTAMAAAEIVAIMVLDNHGLDSSLTRTVTLVGGIGGTVLVLLAVAVRLFDEIQDLRAAEDRAQPQDSPARRG